jgi:hypothetical protein
MIAEYRQYNRSDRNDPLFVAVDGTGASFDAFTLQRVIVDEKTFAFEQTISVSDWDKRVKFVETARRNREKNYRTGGMI